MATIELRPVTKDNWEEAIALRVRQDQEEFVPSVAISLAKAYIRPDDEPVEPLAAYADGVMVGFCTVSHVPESTRGYYINGFLIDHRYQGHGYGRAALARIINLIKTTYPRCEAIGLTLEPHNEVARRLYESVGFEATGHVVDNELAFRLVL